MYRHPQQRSDNHSRKPRDGRGFVPPNRGPAASAGRTRNFGQLVTACGGEESLGERLNVPLARIKELREGYSFSDETAFHIESELELPSGWLDRPNATLPQTFSAKPMVESSAPSIDVTPPKETDVAKKQATETSPAAASAPAPTPPAAEVKPRATTRSTPAKSMQVITMPGLGGGTPTAPQLVDVKPAAVAAKPARKAPAAKKAPAAQAAAPAPAATPAIAPQDSSSGPSEPSTTSTPVKETRMPRGPRINEPEEMMALRRANVMLLTDFPGGKTGIGRLMGKSPANISHVLHGKKKFTRDVGVEFETALRLPELWLDTAQTAADVPAHVPGLLQEAFNSKDTTVARAPAAKPPARTVPRAAAPRPAVVAASPAQSNVAAMLSATPAAPSAPVVARKVVATPAVPEQLAVEMDELEARPFAQALVRIIVLLSRSNQLNEEKCLRLLNEVTLMASSPAAA